MSVRWRQGVWTPAPTAEIPANRLSVLRMSCPWLKMPESLNEKLANKISLATWTLLRLVWMPSCRLRSVRWKLCATSQCDLIWTNMNKGLFVHFSPQDKIKWGNVTRILVYTSDDTFHMAGDGRLAGVFQPHNGQCHLNDNGSYNGRAYVSITHLMDILCVFYCRWMPKNWKLT